MIGEQLVAPEGCGPLCKGRVYHLLGRYGNPPHVLLVTFDVSPPAAHLQEMGCADFESALAVDHIVPVAKPATVPPWHSELEGRDLSRADVRRSPSRKTKTKLTNEQRVDKRLECIRPLVKRIREIFSLDDPRQEVGRYARHCTPELNESRTWLWLLVYLAFGRNKWALFPSYVGTTGCWTRVTGQPEEKKYGRTSLSRGKRFGYGRCKSFIDKIHEGWKEFHRLGVFQNEIVEQILTEKFGCRVRTVEGIRKEFYHPRGEPFPTQWQIRYEILKHFGREAVQLAIYGEVRVRTRKRASKGKFSEAVANLLERMNGDAYYVDEVPIGPVDGEPMPPLCVVRLRDLISGMIVGIGFTLGSERAAAYQMALFCMAMPKDEFCALFGLIIARALWLCEGWPSWATFDRGPGSIAELIAEFEDRIPIRELTPSWQGQSNAPVEASHPRKMKPGGKPTYRQSALNYVQLAKREISRAIRDNQSIDMSAHMTPNMIKAKVLPSPLGLWNYFDRRRRTDAHPIPLEIAVRALLTKIEFSVQEDGVYVHGQRFDSEALRETGLHDRVITRGVFPVPGYMVDLTARQAWIEVDQQLVRVDAMLPIRDHKGQLFVSLRELADLNHIRAIIRSQFQDHRAAVRAESRQQFGEETGKNWDAGQTKAGRAKRGTPQARQEFADVKRAIGGGGRKA